MSVENKRTSSARKGGKNILVLPKEKNWFASPPWNSISEHNLVVLALIQKTAGKGSLEAGGEPSFWSVLALTAKSVLAVDGPSNSESKAELQTKKEEISLKEQTEASKQGTGMGRPLQKSLDAIASSLALIGDKLGNALEEGFQMMEGRPVTLRNASTEESKSSEQVVRAQESAPGGLQLKASRDVASAMASKAKLLLRELKTVKADQTFLKSRCTQLEEENRQLREGVHQGDDFVRQQLESLLAEKQRLAQENANYARENQLLHEVVEYHHLTLQDIALLDDRLIGSNDSYSMDLDEGSCHDQ